MSARVTVAQRVAELVRQHGSYRAAADVVGIDFAKLHKIGTGKAYPGPRSLRLLSLDRATATYSRLTSG